MLDADVYQQLGEGQISEDEVQQLEALDGLLKGANLAGDAAKFTSGDAKRLALTALAIGGTNALVGAGMYQGTKAVGALWDKATFNRDLNRILKVYPQLKEHSASDRRLAYASLRNMNPHFAKDPLVGGTLLGRILRDKNPADPNSGVRFSGDLAADLVKSRVRDDDPLAKMMGDAGSRGAQSAIDHHMKDRSSQRAMQADQAWRSEQAELDHGARVQAAATAARQQKQNLRRSHLRAESLEAKKHQNALQREAFKAESAWYGPQGEEVHPIPHPNYGPAEQAYEEAVREHERLGLPGSVEDRGHYHPSEAKPPIPAHLYTAVKVDHRRPDRDGFRAFAKSKGIKTY
jgi:hypothetical protein